jgi:hypothetical protein
MIQMNEVNFCLLIPGKGTESLHTVPDKRVREIRHISAGNLAV